MSGHGTARLVHAGDTSYQHAALAVTVGSLLAFALGVGALFEWVPVARDVGGVTAATWYGAGLLALGAVTGALGALSRWGGVRTTPDASPGAVVGAVQTLLWMLAVGTVADNTLGLGAAGWVVGVAGGLLAGYLTIASREDAGATLPSAALVSAVGAVVLGGVVVPGWAWTPATFDVTVPGRLAVPLLGMGCALLVGWASASARAGFGSRGRQHGAFLLVSLVVSLSLSVLVFLLVFVFERGAGVVLENLTVGAGTALVLLATGMALLARGGLRPTTTDGTDAILDFVRLAATSALGLSVVGLAYAVVTGRTLTSAGVTVEPTATIGAMPGIVAGVVLLSVARRAPAWTPGTDAGHTVRRALRLAVGALCAAALVEAVTSVEFAAGGVAVVPAVAAVVLVAALAGAVARGLASASTLPSSLPPLSRAAVFGLAAFVVLCLHAVGTGTTVGAGPFAVTTGTVDWPFVTNPSQGLGIQKGVMPALLGTVWIVLGAVVFAVPLAVGAAVFLTEYAEDTLFTSAVDVATNGLWSTPSIVFGLFGLAFLVPRFGGTPSIFAAQLVLGFMLLPLVLITSREAMKSVPDEHRDASAALGVSKWQTVRSVVVPAAMPGVVTGAILGVGRIAGETAPLLLVLNGPNFPGSAPGVISGFAFALGPEPPFVHVSNPALMERASALPYQLYAVITAGVGAEESFGWGTTLVLLGVVLAFFAVGVATRRYFRRQLHQ